VHEATVRVSWNTFTLRVDLLLLSHLLFVYNSLSLGQEHFFLAIVDLELQLSNDAVLSLTVGCSIQEQSSVKVGSFGGTVESAILAFILDNSLNEVFDWEVGVSNDVLSVILEEGDGHVEQLFFPSLLRIFVVIILSN